MLRRILTTVFCVIVGIHVVVGLPSALLARFPHREKLADCTADSFKLELKVATGPPYHLFIVLPTVGTNGVDFRGDVVISRDSQQVAMLPIGSEDLYPSAWLKGRNAHILTWSQTNHSKLNSAIVRGQMHTFDFRFSEPPPEGSSVWLSSLASITNYAGFWIMETILVLVGICLLVWSKLNKTQPSGIEKIQQFSSNI